MPTEFEPPALWSRFRDTFKAEAEACDLDDLAKAWASRTERTCFYADLLLQRVARSLKLELVREPWKIDFAMTIASSNGSPIPIVFIESENDVRDADHEVRKLCCHAAPLKVLITVAAWDESPGSWPGGGHKSEHLRRWQDIVREHGTVWLHRGLLGVLVGEWHDKKGRFRFYAYAISPDGSLVDSGPEVLVDRPV